MRLKFTGCSADLLDEAAQLGAGHPLLLVLLLAASAASTAAAAAVATSTEATTEAATLTAAITHVLKKEETARVGKLVAGLINVTCHKKITFVYNTASREAKEKEGGIGEG